MLFAFVLLAVAARLASLAVSRRNEARLRAAGAREVGAGNSRLLALAHTAFYLAAAAEGLLLRGTVPDAASAAGLLLYLLGMAALVAVIRGLGRFWTVKLMIAEDHRLVRTPLFRRLRHPNYFLNLLPELVGFALVLHAWVTLAIGLPLYLVPLVVRIRQEEAEMRERFADY